MFNKRAQKKICIENLEKYGDVQASKYTYKIQEKKIRHKVCGKTKYIIRINIKHTFGAVTM